MKKKLLNFAWGTITCQWNEADDTPSEIMIYDTIGRDPWSEGGIGAKDFMQSLAEVPTNRALAIHVNSRGGDVWEGQTMHNTLLAWKAKNGQKVTTVIDGIAASTSSWAFSAASDEVHAYRNSQVFIHDAIALGWGNADDLRKTADDLDKTSDQIAGMYADMTDKPIKDMRDRMRANTLMTGEEACDEGFVDKIIDGKSVKNFTTGEIANMSQFLKSFKNSVAQRGGKNKETQMNKKKIIAVLNKHGIKEWEGVRLSEDTSDEHLETALNSVLKNKPVAPPESDDKIINLTNQIAKLTEANNAQKTFRITNEIEALVKNDQLTEKEKPAALARALADESYLNDLRARPSAPVGAEPLNVHIDVNASPKEVVRGFANFGEPMKRWKSGQDVSMKDLSDAAAKRAEFLQKNILIIGAMMNTNTIATELKRSYILGVTIRDFVRRTIPLNAFSTVFQNVPLWGTNKVVVPFYDLDTSAARSWDPAVGYTPTGNTVIDKREITIGTGATDGDRAFVELSFSSEEIARQPFLKIQQLVTLKMEALAAAIVNDVMTIITAANYGAAAITSAVGAFDSDDLADLVTACKLWPLAGRSLILASEYHGNLLKDSAFKAALNAASDLAIKEGRLNPRVMGFDYYENPTIPDNGENLRGFAVFQSAILVATAPVPPLEEVRNAGTTYEIVSDPASGISLEYRTFGDNTLDTAMHILELSYGFAKGNGNALKRIVAP